MLTQEHDTIQKKLSATQVYLTSANALASHANATVSAIKDDLASSEQQTELAQQGFETTKHLVEELKTEANETRAGRCEKKAREGLADTGGSSVLSKLYNSSNNVFSQPQRTSNNVRRPQGLVPQLTGPSGGDGKGTFSSYRWTSW